MNAVDNKKTPTNEINILKKCKIDISKPLQEGIINVYMQKVCIKPAPSFGPKRDLKSKSIFSSKSLRPKSLKNSLEL
jgi:hypothetical protein